MAAHVCLSSYGGKHKVGGSQSRQAWAKSETPISKTTTAKGIGGVPTKQVQNIELKKIKRAFAFQSTNPPGSCMLHQWGRQRIFWGWSCGGGIWCFMAHSAKKRLLRITLKAKRFRGNFKKLKV
jgi:hypothetical protein